MPQIIRASLESIAYQSKDVFDAMRKAFGRDIRELKVDGGACKNDFLMQFQADMLGAKIIRPKEVELTAHGVAHLAAVTLKLWKSATDVKKKYHIDRVFHPGMNKPKRDALYQGWLKAVQRAMLL